MRGFKDRVALITGAGNGFGREFAREANRRGMRLFLADIDEADLKRTQREIQDAGGRAEICVADVSLESEVDRMVQDAISAWGQIDLLINNAGIAIGGSVTDLPSRDWEWIIGVNNMSQIYAMKRVIPMMMRQGTPCHIVNVASMAGLVTMNGMPAYFATKHFCVALSESVCYDLQAAGADIGMSVYCPSFIRTDLHHYERHRPARFQAPEDPYYSSLTYRKYLRMAKLVVTTGTPIEPVGPCVFDAIEKDKFYIEPHPEGKQLIRHRTRNILKGRRPNLQFINVARARQGGNRSLKLFLRLMKIR